MVGQGLVGVGVMFIIFFGIIVYIMYKKFKAS